jgi:CTP:molybdopterin cytidylyltransferase MocA
VRRRQERARGRPAICGQRRRWADPRGRERLTVVGLVLAAGSGTRFGGAKQLAELAGRPLLEHALQAMAGAPVDAAFVILGAHSDEIRARVDLHGATVIVTPDWESGQSASLRAGVAAARRRAANAVVVTLGDQPRISAEAIARVVAAGPPAARATYGGTPGHPVLIGASLFAAVSELRGDTGARDLLRGVDVVDVACDGLGSPHDVDTPADV